MLLKQFTINLVLRYLVSDDIETDSFLLFEIVNSVALVPFLALMHAMRILFNYSGLKNTLLGLF